MPAAGAKLRKFLQGICPPSFLTVESGGRIPRRGRTNQIILSPHIYKAAFKIARQISLISSPKNLTKHCRRSGFSINRSLAVVRIRSLFYYNARNTHYYILRDSNSESVTRRGAFVASILFFIEEGRRGGWGWEFPPLFFKKRAFFLTIKNDI